MTKGINLMSAGGTRYTTQNTGGGNKKAGFTPRATGFMLGSSTRPAVFGTNGRGNALINKNPIYVNQLGGVSPGNSAFSTGSDGVHVRP